MTTKAAHTTTATTAADRMRTSIYVRRTTLDALSRVARLKDRSLNYTIAKVLDDFVKNVVTPAAGPGQG